jgi:rhamnose utilization protein RhaD (predicted bifunctional aldolase and dehydrogenase)/NAD(P)-dependent dehydrogenase (short-subunit alcohol dehydrogenase family)
MNQRINELVEISRFYGSDKNFVIAGGGNTSYKDDKTLWIKASGQSLADLTGDNLVALSREKLRGIAGKVYPDDPVTREDNVKADLYKSITDPAGSKRPSVETSLHELISYSFVVHLHPALVNGILCSRNGRNITLKLFGEKVLFVPYTDPGYTLFKKLEKEILGYRDKFGRDPQVIFLENHGVFAAADTAGEIKTMYEKIIMTARDFFQDVPEEKNLPPDAELIRSLPAIRMMLSAKEPVILRHANNNLVSKYCTNQKEFHKISLPLTPDNIVYCKTRYLFIEHSSTSEKILESLRDQLPRFKKEHGFLPKILVIKDMGVIAADESYSSAESVLDTYLDMIRISHYAGQGGGIKFLTPEQIAFIDQWEVENYRRKIVSSGSGGNKLANRIAVVTGGARGFGAGIAGAFHGLNLNIVVADLNEEEGRVFVDSLNKEKKSCKAIFTRADVSDPASVKDLVATAVSEFGGLDIMISNAGVLKAGGLDEMDPGIFSKTTEINYNGYFYCAKYASEIMRLQNSEKAGYYTDIIQINSKSGLRGSNRNFAYAGAKFGGIGLTQSFALELAADRIKVNAVCPGNFYEGPLWSDPANGLFIQYLKTGKVPGAKSIDDVRKFYENQVPMKRGCRLEDVMKAILYIIDQEYETGQAIPVTGGQIMLG